MCTCGHWHVGAAVSMLKSWACSNAGLNVRVCVCLSTLALLTVLRCWAACMALEPTHLPTLHVHGSAMLRRTSCVFSVGVCTMHAAHEPASLDAHIDLSSGAHNDNNSPVGGLMTGSPTNGLMTSCVSQRDRDSVEASSPLKRHKSTGALRTHTQHRHRHTHAHCRHGCLCSHSHTHTHIHTRAQLALGPMPFRLHRPSSDMRCVCACVCVRVFQSALQSIQTGAHPCRAHKSDQDVCVCVCVCVCLRSRPTGELCHRRPSHQTRPTRLLPVRHRIHHARHCARHSARHGAAACAQPAYLARADPAVVAGGAALVACAAGAGWAMGRGRRTCRARCGSCVETACT